MSSKSKSVDAANLNQLFSILNNQAEDDRLITLKTYHLSSTDRQNVCGQLQLGRIFSTPEYRQIALNDLDCLSTDRSDRSDFINHTGGLDSGDGIDGDEKCSATGKVLRYSNDQWNETFANCKIKGEPVEGDEKCSPSGTVMRFSNHSWYDLYTKCKK